MLFPGSATRDSAGRSGREGGDFLVTRKTVGMEGALVGCFFFFFWGGGGRGGHFRCCLQCFFKYCILGPKRTSFCKEVFQAFFHELCSRVNLLQWGY